MATSRGVAENRLNERSEAIDKGFQGGFPDAPSFQSILRLGAGGKWLVLRGKRQLSARRTELGELDIAAQYRNATFPLGRKPLNVVAQHAFIGLRRREEHGKLARLRLAPWSRLCAQHHVRPSVGLARRGFEPSARK